MTRLIVSNIISAEYFKEHLHTPYFIIVQEIPFVIILITNIFLIEGLIENSRRKQEMTSDSAERLMKKQKHPLPKTVMIVTVVYLICMVPNRIMVRLLFARVVVNESNII